MGANFTVKQLLTRVAPDAWQMHDRGRMLGYIILREVAGVPTYCGVDPDRELLLGTSPTLTKAATELWLRTSRSRGRPL
jgi:hypothetical protein